MASVAQTSAVAARTRERVELPRRWHWLIRGFRKYVWRYVRKHFHAVRLSRAGHPVPATDEPVLLVMNHPAWWDPMIGVILSDLFPRHDHFPAIDAVALKKYAIFKRLGFIGVDTTSLRGAVEFLRAGQTVLAEPRRIFWVTAQGRFTDVRERPLGLRSGVGHLAARLERGIVLPLALEYAFWSERTPEALVRFGEPLRIEDRPGLTGKEWTELIEVELTHALDELNAEAITRDPARFADLLTGRVGVGGFYDRWRRIKSWAKGERFDASHAGEAQP